MRILFATAELAPLFRVGGLSEAAGGLVQALRSIGLTVDVVVPDYAGEGADGTLLQNQVSERVNVPTWVGEASARTGHLEGFGEITLVDVPDIQRYHPYVEVSTGRGWQDNDRRFIGFSAAVAGLALTRKVDVLHLNDWHTAAALAFVPKDLPSIFSIHNLAYQGTCDGGWLNVLGDFGGDRQRAYEWYGSCNPMAGALRLAHRIVTVSPTYAREIMTPDQGMGHHELLQQREKFVVGILNGIDATEWNPESDRFTEHHYSAKDLKAGHAKGKIAAKAALRAEFGLPETAQPLIGVVTRFAEQKGIDLVVEAGRFLDTIGAQLIVLGSGDPALATRVRQLESSMRDRVAFREGFDIGLSHRVFAGADMFLMPSRFEPCGLAQMQAMRYGTIPIVTDVGGLHDTVVDADVHEPTGNGFVTKDVSVAGIVDALHRAVRGWNHVKRRASIIGNGMSTDWSWHGPATVYESLYRSVV